MKNSNLINENPEDEIDLIEILRTIYSSKKLIILITLASALLAFIYLAQKESVYQSTVIIEVGSYELLSSEKKISGHLPSLIKKLKNNQISQQLNKLNFNSIEDQFLEINYTSPSPEVNENLINEAIRFTQESHVEVLDKIVNSYSEKIVAIDNEVELLKNLSSYNKESKKLEVTNEINRVDAEVGLINIKIKFLSKLLITQKNDLILEDQLMLFQAKVKELETKKKSLEEKIKLIDSSDFVLIPVSLNKEVFELKVEKNSIEKQIKLIKNSISKTRSIREIQTSEIKPKQLLIILIGTIFGFIFSVLIVFIRLFIRQAFLKEQN